jgi:F-type H+-transporting ATPase subunit gamma
MANLKEVRNRIASTQSTQQITKAMKMVSATKLRKAQNAIGQMRPYADKLNGILMNLSEAAKDEQALQGYFEHREVKSVLLIVNSSDRGLCGGFNSNITKEIKSLLAGRYKNTNVELMFLGKKAYEYFKRSELTMNTTNMKAFLDLNSDEVFGIGEEVINSFLAGKYDEVRVLYNKFKNAATQIVTAEKLLPVELEAFETKGKEQSKYLADFSFEPSKADLLFTIIPRAVKTQLYRTMLDSQASEHGSRMVAMDKATENAGELIFNLKLQYNQARQAAITTEILEIVGGAAALEG